MRAYLKDHIGSIVFFYSQIGLVLLIAQLAVSVNGAPISHGNIVYMLLIVSFFLLVNHIIRYLKYRDIYKYATKDTSETAWLPEAPDELTSQLKEHYENQYQLYKQEIESLYAEKKQESMFMQQWIHQMKTPLSVMALTLEKEKQALPQPIKQSLEEELDRMKHGLQLALYQSRLQQFERDFHVDKINVKELVHSIIQDYKSSFIRHYVYPKIEIDDHLFIYSDKKWLGFVLEQLTSNAIKYAEGTKTQIEFVATSHENIVQLHIKDQGIGIPKQDLTRIFDPFFTGENGRSYRESTGMGLFLAKQICDDLGHIIEVDSKSNDGTTFTLIFNTN